MFNRKTVKTAIALTFAGALAACSSGDEDKYVARDVEVLYNLAGDALDNRAWTKAAILFDEVERQHPYSSWARRSQLQAAYAHYMSNKYDDAILAAERFLQLHPGNRDADYAYYLIAISHYEQIVSVERDQVETQAALTSLNEVIRRFPESEYAQDARLKLDLTHDHLAGKEMYVGRFYLRENSYLAAAKRFRNVIETYQTTSHVPEAMHRLVEVYLAMGVEAEARRVASVLGHNYPGSKWYEYSYNLLQKQ